MRHLQNHRIVLPKLQALADRQCCNRTQNQELQLQKVSCRALQDLPDPRLSDLTENIRVRFLYL